MSAQMNPVSSATEERNEVPIDQIPTTTVPVTEHVTEPVSKQSGGRVGRRPVQDYVGRCNARIEELREKIART